MKKTYSTVWAGNDTAFELYLQALEREVDFLTAAAVMAGPVDDGDDMLDVQGGIGIIQVKGVLTNVDAWYNKYLGLVSYASIQEVLYRAVSDPGVHELLMDIGSPGGSVFGLSDAVEAVASAAAVKPVTVFSDSMMASAAMWLAAPAQKKYIAPLAVAGSIGVIAKHVEFSKARAEQGITETLVRAGEFKQLANTSEPLSEKAKAELQAQVLYSYGIFINSMAKFYGKSPEYVDRVMAQGRDFIGAQAVEVGLVDGISSFDQVYAAIQKRLSTKDTGGGMMGKKRYAMSEAAKIAAAAAGVILGEIDETAGPAASAGTQEGGDGVTPETPASENPAPEAQKGEGEEGGEAPKGEGEEGGEEGATTSQASAPETSLSALDFAKAQIKEKDEEIFSLKSELAKALADAEAVPTLKGIAAKSVNNMIVALGGTALDLETATAAEVIAHHETTAPRFAAEFKVGGVGAAPQDPPAPAKTTPKVTRLDAARFAHAPRKA